MSKAIKLTFSDEDYAKFELHARKNNHSSVQALVKFLLHSKTRPSEPFKDGGIKPTPAPKQGVQFSAEFVKKFSINPNATTPSEAGGNHVIDYAVRGAAAFPLYPQMGMRSPCLDGSSMHSVALWYAERKANFRDVTDQLTEEENRWIDCWLKDFDRMDGLWWFRNSELMETHSVIGLEDCVVIMDRFDQGKTHDQLWDERAKAEGEVTESFVGLLDGEVSEDDSHE